jgi:8-oxo-dGTP pyrophosphatase MutT (NUDIX family)
MRPGRNKPPTKDTITYAAYKPSAVILPILKRNDDYLVLLTLRNARLKYHAQQLCLPGGKQDSNDGSLQATALRELEEELDIPNKAVEIIASLPSEVTSSNFRVHPFCGVIKQPITIKENPAEVDAVIEIPLHYAADINNYKINEDNQHKLNHHFYCISYENNLVWGVTASILKRFAESNLAHKLP